MKQSEAPRDPTTMHQLSPLLKPGQPPQIKSTKVEKIKMELGSLTGRRVFTHKRQQVL